MTGVIPIYLNNNLYEINEYDLNNIFSKKLLILKYNFDINNFLMKLSSLNTNIKGVVVTSFDCDYLSKNLRNFEKFNYNGYIKGVLEYALDNYNSPESVFVLKIPIKEKILVEFIKKYTGTFIYIIQDCDFYKFMKDENYTIFDYIMIHDFGYFSKKSFFENFKDNLKNNLFEDLLKISTSKLFLMFGEFSHLIFDTNMENLYFYFNQEFTRKKLLFDINEKNILKENLKEPEKKHIMFNFTKNEYLEMGLSLLKKDFFRFSKLHSWYKHIPLKGTKYYFYLEKGEQIRNILEKDVEDYEELHWHFSINKPKDKKYGKILFGPFLNGELHGFEIIKSDAGEEMFKEFIENNYPEFYILGQKYTKLNFEQKSTIVEKEYLKYWTNLKEEYLKTFN
jgi:hypothetical protein